MAAITRAVAVVLLLPLFAQPAEAGGLAYITVKCKNIREVDQVYEMKDNRDGRIWTQLIKARQTVSISLQSSQDAEDGYGDLLYRINGEAQWSRSGQLRHDQTITL